MKVGAKMAKKQISITIDSKLLETVKRVSSAINSNNSEIIEISVRSFFQSKKGMELLKKLNIIEPVDLLKGLK